ncbi:fumarate hydratase C-terminal domain-containing protein [Pseudomonas juntendi]
MVGPAGPTTATRMDKFTREAGASAFNALCQTALASPCG